MKDQAGAVVSGGSIVIRKTLVVAQVTLSLLLLIGAGLFIRSLQNLRDLDPGFRMQNLMHVSVDPPSEWLYGRADVASSSSSCARRMDALPGVESASLAVVPVLAGDEWDSSITVEGIRANRARR